MMIFCEITAMVAEANGEHNTNLRFPIGIYPLFSLLHQKIFASASLKMVIPYKNHILSMGCLHQPEPFRNTLGHRYFRTHDNSFQKRDDCFYLLD